MSQQFVDNLLEAGIKELSNCRHEGRYREKPVEKIVAELERAWNEKAHQEAEQWALMRTKKLMKHSLYSAAILFIGVSIILLLGGKSVIAAGFFFISGFVAGIYGTNLYYGRHTTIENIFMICSVQNVLDIWKYIEGKKYEECAKNANEEEKESLLKKAKLYYSLIPEGNIETVMQVEEVLLYRTHSHVGKILQDFQQG